MNNETKTTIKKLSSRLRAVLLGGALVLAGVSLAFSNLAIEKDQPEGAKVVPARLSVDDTPIKRDGRLTTSFAPVVKQVAPSVVKINTTTESRRMRRPAMPQEDMFRWFFGGESPFGGGGEYRTPRQRGLGSGVIATKDGYILTNNHVVENADDIKVALNDGREFTAKLVGKDSLTDIAVLKVNADNLPFLTLGDSDKIEVGDLVLAVGNPFNVGLTVTTGIISAKGRTLPMLEGMNRLEDFLQTDAAINPGNSGGALVDADGRLVGINTAIISSGGFGGMGGNVGIGFAVPSNLARFVMESVIKDGRVVRGYMGVMNLQPVTEALARAFKIKSANGALVGDVVPGGPAERAGMKSGDVIIEFSGRSVEDDRTLRLRVAQTAPGTRVPVTVVRDGDEKTVQLTLKEFPTENELASKPGRSGEGGQFEENLDGVTVTDLNRATRTQFRIPANVNGAVVVEVAPDSASYEAGYAQADVILEINRKPVSNADEAVKLSDRVKNDTALLRVWSRGGSHYIVVDQKKN